MSTYLQAIMKVVDGDLMPKPRVLFFDKLIGIFYDLFFEVSKIAIGLIGLG